MAENPQPRGFDVNQPGSGRETGIGLLQGATTDLVGGLVDFFESNFEYYQLVILYNKIRLAVTCYPCCPRHKVWY